MRSRYDERGREIPDPTPVEIPLGFRKPESLTDQIRRLIRTQLSAVAVAEGHESFREANDFDVDEEDPEAYLTPYQVVGMQEEIPIEYEQRNGSKEDSGSSADGKGGPGGPHESGSGSEGTSAADGKGDNDGSRVGAGTGKGTHSVAGDSSGTSAAGVRK